MACWPRSKRCRPRCAPNSPCGATEQLPELNSDFHRALSEASGYRILAELTEQLLLTIRRFRIASPVDTQNWQAVVEEHDAIIEALRLGDPAGAAAAAQAHTISQAWPTRWRRSADRPGAVGTNAPAPRPASAPAQRRQAHPLAVTVPQQAGGADGGSPRVQHQFRTAQQNGLGRGCEGH